MLAKNGIAIVVLIFVTALNCVHASIAQDASATAAQVQKPVPTKNNPVADGGLQLSGRYQLVEGTRSGFLILKARIPNGSYTYSVSQPKGGPPATKIQIQKANSYLVKGKFIADKKPQVIEKDDIFNMRIEKHRETVQFFIPIKIHPDLKPAQVRPIMKIDAQICSEAGICTMIQNRKIAAEFAGFYKQQAQTQESSQNRKR